MASQDRAVSSHDDSASACASTDFPEAESEVAFVLECVNALQSVPEELQMCAQNAARIASLFSADEPAGCGAWKEPGTSSVDDVARTLFSIVESETKGRIVVAQCDMAPGTEVMRDTPLLKCAHGAGAYDRLKCYVDQAADQTSAVTAAFDLSCPLEAVPKGKWKSWQNEAQRTLKKIAANSGKEILDVLSAEDAAKLLCIWQVNGLANGPRDYLFPLASKLEHSCVPNCVAYFPNEDTITIHTIRSVKEGEDLSISYCWQYLPTVDRRRWLFDGYFFNCSCTICCGPDQARAFRCPACQDGVAYPAVGGSAAYGCVGVMAAAMGMGSSTEKNVCMWCGTAGCMDPPGEAEGYTEVQAVACSKCGIEFAADSKEASGLRSSEEEIKGTPAFQRDIEGILSEGALHWSHHLLVHAAIQQLGMADSLGDVVRLSGYVLSTYDMVFGVTYSEKVQHLDLVAKHYVQAKEWAKAKAVLRAAYVIRRLGRGESAEDSRCAKHLAQHPEDLAMAAQQTGATSWKTG